MHLLPIDRDILRITWPAIVTNITVPLLGLVDVAIVGHIGEARHIGAIAIATMVFNVIYWMFAFLRMGTSGLTAQAYGANEKRQCLRLLSQAIVIALAVAAVLLLLQHPIRNALYALIAVTPAMEPLVDTYYHIAVWGIPAMLCLYSITGWFIGMQNTRATMTISISQNIINILLSLLLVFAFHMDIAGVALGTVLAQWGGLAIAIVLQRKGERHTSPQQRLHHADTLSESDTCHATPVRQVFHTYLFIFLRTFFLVAVNLAFVAFGTSLGELTLAVNTLLMQLFMLYSYITDGFAYAGEALSGKHLGARQHLQLQQTVRRLFLWGCGVMTVFTLLYAVGAPHFLSLLTNDDTVLQASHQYLPWIIAVPAAGMAAFVWDGIFIGTTRTAGMLLATAIAALFFFTLWYWLRDSWGNHALWMAFIAFLLGRGMVQTIAWNIHPNTIE